MLKRLSLIQLGGLALLLIGLLVFAGARMAQAEGQDFTPVSTPQGAYPYADDCRYGQGQQGQNSMSGMGWHGGGMHDDQYRYGGCAYSRQHDWGMMPGGMHGWNMMPGYPYGGNTAVPLATVPSTTTTPVSFKADVQPIFKARCVNCHGGAEGLYLDSYANVMRGGEHGPVIVPGNPAGSLLIQRVSNGTMPAGGPPLTPPQIQTLVNWVATGAPNN